MPKWRTTIFMLALALLMACTATVTVPPVIPCPARPQPARLSSDHKFDTHEQRVYAHYPDTVYIRLLNQSNVSTQKLRNNIMVQFEQMQFFSHVMTTPPSIFIHVQPKDATVKNGQLWYSDRDALTIQQIRDIVQPDPQQTFFIADVSLLQDYPSQHYHHYDLMIKLYDAATGEVVFFKRAHSRSYAIAKALVQPLLANTKVWLNEDRARVQAIHSKKQQIAQARAKRKMMANPRPKAMMTHARHTKSVHHRTHAPSQKKPLVSMDKDKQ